MIIEANIKVMNNVTLNIDQVRVSTPCVGSISLFVPAGDKVVEFELSRKELTEFLLRTQPSVELHLQVNALKDRPI